MIAEFVLVMLLQSKPLIVPASLGTTHSVLIWTDDKNQIHKEQVPQKVSNDQANKPSGAPPKPSTFVGTDQDWTGIWNAGKARLLGGRDTVNTPSGEYEDGTARPLSNGAVRIYSGDQDLEEPITLKSTEYTGSLPAITTNKCGISIINGDKSNGKPNANCK